MNIHIFYRHYNVCGSDSNRPQWFDYEECFKNLLKTIGDSSNVKLTVVYDDSSGTDNWIFDYDVDIVRVDGGSDFNSFKHTANLAKERNIPDDELIYFLENDYLHVDGWVPYVEELFSTYSNLDYVSLYDHNDKYILKMYDNLVSKVFTTKTRHWRTAPSTCGSFIMTAKRFREDYDILSTMEGDHNKFLWLNENRRRFVITPIPGLSTHCMRGLLSPCINWE